jgi:plastocyanin
MRKNTVLNILLLIMVSALPIACSSGQSEKGANATSQASSQEPASSAHVPGEHQVTIQQFKFEPQELTVNVGDTVVFTNQDAMPHNAVSAGKFDSGKIAHGATGKVVAKEKGTFDYICTFHPNMKGRLIVQ